MEYTEKRADSQVRPSNTILCVENVNKKFGDKVVSNNISFNVPQGKIYGLLGPNGAGKTTMIRMICNIFAPDSGNITLFGEQVTNKIQDRIGYLPEERGLYKKAKIIDQIIYFGELKGMRHSEAATSAKKWLAKLGASNWENKKVEELSKGMQQKVQFISTVVHSPDFLILDEPFSGFDPVNTELLKNVILEMKANGTTIILSTHIMSQVEEMCDAVCMLNQGNAVLEGKVSEIKNSYQRNTINIEYSGELNLENRDDVQVVSQNDGAAILRILNKESFNKQHFIADLNEKVSLYKFSMDTPSMHNIFIDVVAGKSV